MEMDNLSPFRSLTEPSLSVTQLKREFTELEERFQRIYEQKGTSNEAIVASNSDTPAEDNDVKILSQTESVQTKRQTKEEIHDHHSPAKRQPLHHKSHSKCLIERSSQRAPSENVRVDSNIAYKKVDEDILAGVKSTIIGFSKNLSSLSSNHTVPKQTLPSSIREHISSLKVNSSGVIPVSGTNNTHSSDTARLINTLPSNRKQSTTVTQQKAVVLPKIRDPARDCSLSPLRPASNPFAFVDR